MPDEIEIQPVPVDIDTTGIHVERKDCFRNAYDLAKSNPGLLVVEGVLLLIANDNTGKAAAHAWNQRDGLHFDITATIWKGEEFENTKSLHYFPNISHTTEDLVKRTSFEFSSDTKKDVDELNALIGLG